MDTKNIYKSAEIVSESLASELKSWISLKTPEGKATIVKTAIAMRNNNGGTIYIGYDNKTSKPIIQNKGNDWVETEYGADEVQKLISKHSSEKFEIRREFRYDEQKNCYPAFVVEGRIKTPVMTHYCPVKH
jgi:predicted HTH transcriptional regulator